MTSHAAHKPSGGSHRRSVALFGGTFDPIHAGHITVAQAAQRRFHLDAIYFIPSSRPPHKTQREHPDDHLYFILGADQFLEIPTWKNYESLLDACDFIIASRPGFRLDALRLVIPPEKFGRAAATDPHKIALRKSEIHLLTTVASHVSSTEVRQRMERKQSIHGLVPARVEEYILRQALYR